MECFLRLWRRRCLAAFFSTKHSSMVYQQPRAARARVPRHTPTMAHISCTMVSASSDWMAGSMWHRREPVSPLPQRAHAASLSLVSTSVGSWRMLRPTYTVAAYASSSSTCDVSSRRLDLQLAASSPRAAATAHTRHTVKAYAGHSERRMTPATLRVRLMPLYARYMAHADSAMPVKAAQRSVLSAGSLYAWSSIQDAAQLRRLASECTSLSSSLSSPLDMDRSSNSLSLGHSRRWFFLSMIASRRLRASARSISFLAWNSSSLRIWFW
mmetsp:Transcript_13426/g.32816  ORF Transcript_13426/g.32816 Transcript_13426/m.32816 type:complete len:269 (-) Transcript_13426:419-1225(-)